jgi:hypothetical protein
MAEEAAYLMAARKQREKEKEDSATRDKGTPSTLTPSFS